MLHIPDCEPWVEGSVSNTGTVCFKAWKRQNNPRELNKCISKSRDTLRRTLIYTREKLGLIVNNNNSIPNSNVNMFIH